MVLVMSCIPLPVVMGGAMFCSSPLLCCSAVVGKGHVHMSGTVIAGCMACTTALCLVAQEAEIFCVGCPGQFAYCDAAIVHDVTGAALELVQQPYRVRFVTLLLWTAHASWAGAPLLGAVDNQKYRCASNARPGALQSGFHIGAQPKLIPNGWFDLCTGTQHLVLPSPHDTSPYP